MEVLWENHFNMGLPLMVNPTRATYKEYKDIPKMVPSRLLLIKGIMSGSTWIFTAPVIQLFLCNIFFIAGFSFLICIIRQLL